MISRKISFVLAIILGITAGLVYGWIINPATSSETTPDTLRADYRTDYVLMVSEAYQGDGNIALAARRLAVFGAASPEEIATQALTTAQSMGYNNDDMQMMARLITGLRAYIPTAVP